MNDSKTSEIETISVHHHVQDGGSTDGTVDWLRDVVDATLSSRNNQSRDEGVASAGLYRLSFTSEPDNGMYDALNRGIHRMLDSQGRSGAEQGSAAPGPQLHAPCPSDDSIVAWLNCDEQYLPGTLQKVAAFFATHPQVEILFGGMLMMDADGNLLACRKAMPMRLHFLEASYLYNFSCAMFFRDSLWHRLGGFDTAFKNAGDEELMLRALRKGARTAVMAGYLSAFTYSEHNLSSGGSAVEEHGRLKRSASKASTLLRVPLNLLRLAEKIARGGCLQRGRVEYDLYVDDMAGRTRFMCEKPSCKWPGCPSPYLSSHRLAQSRCF